MADPTRSGLSGNTDQQNSSSLFSEVDDILGNLTPNLHGHLWYDSIDGLFEVSTVETNGTSMIWNIQTGDLFNIPFDNYKLRYGFDYGYLSLRAEVMFVGCQVKEKDGTIAIQDMLTTVCFLPKKVPGRYKFRVMFCTSADDKGITIDLDIQQARSLLTMVSEVVKTEQARLALNNYVNTLSFSGITYPLQLQAVRRILKQKNISLKDIPPLKGDPIFCVLTYPNSDTDQFYCYIRFVVRSTILTLTVPDFNNLIIGPTYLKVRSNGDDVFQITKRDKYHMSNSTIKIEFDENFAKDLISRLYDSITSKIGKTRVKFENEYEKFVNGVVY